MVLMCADRMGREVIQATPDWLRSTFTSKQIVRLRTGRPVRKGRSPTKRCIYWQRQPQARTR
jgi:hypothetical protein